MDIDAFELLFGSATQVWYFEPDLASVLKDALLSPAMDSASLPAAIAVNKITSVKKVTAGTRMFQVVFGNTGKVAIDYGQMHDRHGFFSVRHEKGKKRRCFLAFFCDDT